MKILFFIKTIGVVGGEEAVTITKANALAQIPGNEVFLAYLYKFGYPKVTSRPLSPNVQVISIGENYGGMPTSFIKAIPAFLRKSWLISRRLKRIITDVKPDVIVNVGSVLRYPFSMIRAKGNQVKIQEYHIASTSRQYAEKTFLPKLQNFIDFKVLSRGYDAVYLLTRADKLDHFASNSRYRVMPNPLTVPFEPEKNDDAKRQKIVLSVGRFNFQKNFPALIRAWARIAHLVPDWKLRIVGDGEERENIENEIIRCNVSAQVELPGVSKHVPDEMRRASIFVLSSRFEGFALVLIEASVCGLPLVSYNTPYGPSDIIENGGNVCLSHIMTRNPCLKQFSA